MSAANVSTCHFQCTEHSSSFSHVILVYFCLSHSLPVDPEKAFQSASRQPGGYNPNKHCLKKIKKVN